MSSADLERLESLLLNRRAEPAEVRAILQRLAVLLAERRATLSPGSLELFVRSYGLLKRMRGSANTPLRLECLRNCFVYFFWQTELPLAFEAAAECHALALRAGSHEHSRFALNALGLACAELGNLGDAVAYYSKALEVERLEGADERQGVVLTNLGNALNYAGLYWEAIPCLRRVAVLWRPSWKKDLRVSALSNIAQSYYYLGDLESALSAIETAVNSSPTPATGEAYVGNTVREYTYSQIALESGRHALAGERAVVCERYARASGVQSCRWMADIVAARYDVIAGNARKGLLSLERVLSETSRVDSAQRDTLIAIVKAYDDAGQPETALVYLERLLHRAHGHLATGIKALMSIQRSLAIDVTGSSTTSGLYALELKHADLRARVAERGMMNTRLEMLERLAVTADLKEDASGEHGYRVGKLSALLASRIGWSDEAAQSLELAARLHDIGKTGIPDRILGSSDALKEAERHLMQAHTSIGGELLSKSDVPQLRMAEEIARRHHECWDGSGYPDGLRGNRIPLHARIVALADVFDALTHGRPYAAPWTTDRALEEIRARRGTQFDPELADAFLGLIEKLHGEHADLDGFLAMAGRDAPLLKARRRIRVMLEEETRHEAATAH